MQRVLIVDDDLSACVAITNFLRDSFTMMACHDGWDIIELMRTFSPDLILLDINLPGPNGFRLLKQIREQAGDIPVFMISVRSGEEDLLMAFDLGAADYLIKPFSLPFSGQESFAGWKSFARNHFCDWEKWKFIFRAERFSGRMGWKN